MVLWKFVGWGCESPKKNVRKDGGDGYGLRRTSQEGIYRQVARGWGSSTLHVDAATYYYYYQILWMLPTTNSTKYYTGSLEATQKMVPVDGHQSVVTLMSEQPARPSHASAPPAF